MEFEISSGVAALLGALVGSLSTIAINYFQQKSQTKRELARIAWEMAKEDFHFHEDRLKKKFDEGTIDYLPTIDTYYRYHLLTVQRGPKQVGEHRTDENYMRLAKRLGYEDPHQS